MFAEASRNEQELAATGDLGKVQLSFSNSFSSHFWKVIKGFLENLLLFLIFPPYLVLRGLGILRLFLGEVNVF